MSTTALNLHAANDTQAVVARTVLNLVNRVEIDS